MRNAEPDTMLGSGAVAQPTSRAWEIALDFDAPQGYRRNSKLASTVSTTLMMIIEVIGM